MHRAHHSPILHFAFLVLAPLASAQVGITTLVDSSSSVVQASPASDNTAPSISDDGRYVAFESSAYNLVPGDFNHTYDVFVRDRVQNTLEAMSIDSVGVTGNDRSYEAQISRDGKSVAFVSFASNLVAGDTNASPDVFVRDRINGITKRVSVDSSGQEVVGYVQTATISGDGSIVAFASTATNLVGGDTNGVFDVFVHDRATGATTRASVATSGAQADKDCRFPSLSADGRYVAFDSNSALLVANDTNGAWDIFVRDLVLNTTTRVSVGPNGLEGNGNSQNASISGDGRFVAFVSGASNLIGLDNNFANDVFVRDTLLGQTICASLTPSGSVAHGWSGVPSISVDGRFVCFDNTADDVVPHDSNLVPDAFVRDLQLGATQRVSVDSLGVQGNSDSYLPVASSGGRFVAFASRATNLVQPDFNSGYDVLVRDTQPPAATNYCTAKSNSLGCTPSIQLSVSPSVGAHLGCVLSASNVLGSVPGLFLHSVHGAQAAPFDGGFLCVKSPPKRHKVHVSSGASGTCAGTFVEDFNAYIASGADPALVAGVDVWLQNWSRDSADAFGDSLTDAVTATIQP